MAVHTMLAPEQGAVVGTVRGGRAGWKVIYSRVLKPSGNRLMLQNTEMRVVLIGVFVIAVSIANSV